MDNGQGKNDYQNKATLVLKVNWIDKDESGRLWHYSHWRCSIRSLLTGDIYAVVGSRVQVQMQMQMHLPPDKLQHSTNEIKHSDSPSTGAHKQK